MRRAAFAVAIVAAVTGCAAPSGKPGDAASAKPTFSLPHIGLFDSPGEKKPMIADLKPVPYQASSLAIGEQKDLARQRGEGLGFVRVETLERYLNGIRGRLVSASGVSNVPGQVLVLANPAYAAYSTADGNVYVAMGWLPYLENEDEVAAILAHELSHVLLTHHSADIVSGVQKKGQALHELGVNAKMALERTSTVAKSDQRALATVQASMALGEKLVMPAWGRRQEREADLLGVDLLVRAGYSPAAMTTMLEKYRAWEKRTQKSDEELQKDVADVAQKDLGKAMSLVLSHVVDKVSASHPDTGQRIEDIATYLDRHYAEIKIPDYRVSPWTAVKGKPDVKEITHNYESAFAARKLLDEHKSKEAYAKAQASASGRTAKDAYPNWIFSKSAAATGQNAEAIRALQRAIGANEPIREIYEEMLLVQERSGRFDTAVQWTDKASITFGEADRWVPHKIRLLRKLGRENEASALTLKCTVETPDWRHQCQEANQTPLLRATR